LNHDFSSHSNFSAALNSSPPGSITGDISYTNNNSTDFENPTAVLLLNSFSFSNKTTGSEIHRYIKAEAITANQTTITYEISKLSVYKISKLSAFILIAGQSARSRDIFSRY